MLIRRKPTPTPKNLNLSKDFTFLGVLQSWGRSLAWKDASLGVYPVNGTGALVHGLVPVRQGPGFKSRRPHHLLFCLAVAYLFRGSRLPQHSWSGIVAVLIIQLSHLQTFMFRNIIGRLNGLTASFSSRLRLEI